MFTQLVKFAKVSARPFYDFFAKPLHRRVKAEVEAEIQQIHQYYLQFHEQYQRKVSEELLSLHNQIQELQRDRLAEQGSNKHE